ncbi:MAG: hypothetical protein ACR2KF_06060 [Nitrososphaeraceae archaeon]
MTCTVTISSSSLSTSSFTFNLNSYVISPAATSGALNEASGLSSLFISMG